MDYEEKYTLPDHAQPLRISWSADFREVEIAFGSRIVEHLKNRTNPLDGILLRDEELGKIELTFHRRPAQIDVVVNDYHHPTNRSHPRRQMKKLSALFWVVSAFFLAIALSWFLLAEKGIPVLNFNEVMLMVMGGLFLFFAAVAILVYNAQIWAYYSGFTVFALIMIYILLTRTIEMMSLVEVVTLLAGLFMLVLIGYHLRTPLALAKKKGNYLQEGRSDLLDS